MTQEQPSFAARVWKKLHAIDVKKTNGVQKKNGMDFLAWATAWQILMEQFPESTFEDHEVRYFAGKNNETTCEVSVTVTVRENENSLSRTMWLPVINNRNDAINAPDAYEINKAKMRCLVKCLSTFGLGLNLYTKDDAPESKTVDLDDLAFVINNADTLDKAKDAAREVWSRASKAQREQISAMIDAREKKDKADATP